LCARVVERAAVLGEAPGEALVVEVALLGQLGHGAVGDLGLDAPTREVGAHLDLRAVPVAQEPVSQPERALELVRRAVRCAQAAFSSGSSPPASASATAGRSSSIGLMRSRSRPIASYTLASISRITSGCSSRWALALARPWPMRSSP